MMLFTYFIKVLLLYRRFILSTILDFKVFMSRVKSLSTQMQALLLAQEQRKVTRIFVYKKDKLIFVIIDPDQYTAISVPAKIIKLLIADTTNNLIADQTHIEDAESVGDDEDVDMIQKRKRGFTDSFS